MGDQQSIEHLTAASHGACRVVEGVADEELARATPCAEYDVRALLNHLFHVVVSFQSLAAKEPADFSTTPDRLTGDWRARFAEENATLLEAWSRPAAWEGDSPTMGMPQTLVAVQLLSDLLLHAWDLARATRQPYAPPAGAVAELLPSLREMAPTGREYGVFGPEVPVGPDAEEFTQLLGLSGRDPAWSA